MLAQLESGVLMKHSGMNMGSVKKQNRSSILNYICEVGPVSRKDIAEMTGLTPAAVTQICNDFIEQGLLFETGQIGESTGAGRKKVMVDLNYDYAYLYSVNIEKEQTTVALTNLKGTVVERHQILTKTGGAPKQLINDVIQLCRSMEAMHPEWTEKIAGISVGIAGIVDKQRGCSVHAYGIWNEEVPVCELLQQALGYPTIIENNVNAFALAELMFGTGKDYDNLLVIKWGPGVGSTIVIDHKVYDGRHGKAAELGHFIIDRDGKLCSCGRHGCLETKVSYQALSEQTPFLPENFGEAYRTAKQKGTSEIFDEAIDLFARTIVNSVTILAPNRVILCGKLFLDSEIRSQLIQNCKRYDERYDENRIFYSTLWKQEDYIGPVATFVQTVIFPAS